MLPGMEDFERLGCGKGGTIGAPLLLRKSTGLGAGNLANYMALRAACSNPLIPHLEVGTVTPNCQVTNMEGTRAMPDLK